MRQKQILVPVSALLLALGQLLPALANDSGAESNGIQEWPAPLVKIRKPAAYIGHQNGAHYLPHSAGRVLTQSALLAPSVAGINLGMAPPGAIIEIVGRNFSPKASDNRVTFGSVPAQVVGATNNELSVIVPQWPYGLSQLNIPVMVTVNGVRAGGSLHFDIGPKWLLPDELQ